MKFGKVLKVSSENMPVEMHDLFLRYKELKKQIKLIPVSKEAAAGNEKQASVSPDGSATGSGSTGGAVTATVLSPEEQAFITTLNEDLARFNRYFIEKEEEAVIRLQALCDELAAAVAAAGLRLPAELAGGAVAISGDPAVEGVSPGVAPAEGTPSQQQPPQQQQHQPAERVTGAEEASGSVAQAPAGPAEAAATSSAEAAAGAGKQAQQRPHGGSHRHQHQHHHHAAELQAVKSRLVQFHGEMVLLLHWSLLNYAAVVKILKKHDKRTGVLLRAPYLANVLQQPFSSTTIMSRLAKRAEELVVATTQLPPLGVAPRADLAAGAAVAGERGPPAAAAAAGPQAGAEGLGAGAVTAGPASEGAEGAGAPSGLAEGAMARTATRSAGGRTAASASDVSSLTFAAAEREVSVYGDAAGQPLVGSTMHALETWANLRKNAITPSTVLTAEAEQQQQQPGKRKADDDPASGAEEAHDTKVARLTDPAGQ